MSTRRILSIAGVLLVLPAYSAAVPIVLTATHSEIFSMSAPLRVEGDFAAGGPTVALSRFDPSLGTLLSAEIGIHAWVTHTFGIQATFAGEALADGVVEISHTGEDLMHAATPPPFFVSCAAIPGASEPTCDASIIHTMSVVWGANYTDPIHLANLTGTGIFDLLLQSYFTFQLNETYELLGYNQTVTMDASWLGSASVTYTYAVEDTISVDEPGSLALLMAGLLAGMSRRRPKAGVR